MNEHAFQGSLDVRSHNQRKETAAHFLFLIALAETLFIPRLGILFNVPLHIYLIWLFVLTGMVRVRLVMPTIILMFSVLVAIYRGTDAKTPQLQIEDLKRGMQLISYAAYWLVFSGKTMRFQFGSPTLIFFYSVWTILLYMSFKAVLHGALDLTRLYPEMWTSLEVNRAAERFPLMFEDPNSAGYFFVFILAGICISPASPIKVCVISMALGVAVYLTGSRGAFSAFALVLLLWILGEVTKKNSRQLGRFIVVLMLTMVAILPTAFDRVAAEFKKRNEIESEMGMDFGATRQDKYRSWIDSEEFLTPFGRGYVWLIDGAPVLPHSDLIRIQLAYGVVGLVCLLVIYFPSNFAQLMLFAAAAAPLLINTLIDDYRLMGIFSLLYFWAQERKGSGSAA